jgi:hypothetical protein
MEFITTNWQDILLAVTSIVTAASIIVKITPTPKDDAVLAKVIAVLNVLAINKAK